MPLISPTETTPVAFIRTEAAQSRRDFYCGHAAYAARKYDASSLTNIVYATFSGPCTGRRYAMGGTALLVRDLSHLVGLVDATGVLKDNWNGYGSPAPSPTARENARRVLENLAENSPDPSRISPSAEGGIAITFARGGKIATVECSNSGAISAVRSDRVQEPEAWDVAGEMGLRDTLQRIAAFLA